MIAKLREAGIRKAIIAKSRGGDPTAAQGIQREAIRAADQAGYLIGGYHNYSWIQGRWIDRDPTLKDAAVMSADGTFKTLANAWDSKGRLDRCPAAHQSVFVQNGQAARNLGINYFFTDCTTTGGSIQECYHPEHSLSRREGVGHLNRALKAVSDLGLVIGSERGKWWATSTTHVFEGIETLIDYGGPYYGSGNETHWVGPYLKNKPGFRELFLGFDSTQPVVFLSSNSSIMTRSIRQTFPLRTEEQQVVRLEPEVAERRGARVRDSGHGATPMLLHKGQRICDALPEDALERARGDSPKPATV